MSLFAFVGQLARCTFLPPIPILLSRIRGPRNIPHMPIKGPRDFDYWRRLKRKNPSKPTRMPKVKPSPRRGPRRKKIPKKIEKQTEK